MLKISSEEAWNRLNRKHSDSLIIVHFSGVRTLRHPPEPRATALEAWRRAVPSSGCPRITGLMLHTLFMWNSFGHDFNVAALCKLVVGSDQHLTACGAGICDAVEAAATLLRAVRKAAAV